MVNKLRTSCERKSNKKHRSDALFNSTSELGSETGMSTIVVLWNPNHWLNNDVTLIYVCTLVSNYVF